MCSAQHKTTDPSYNTRVTNLPNDTGAYAAPLAQLDLFDSRGPFDGRLFTPLPARPHLGSSRIR